MRTPRLRRGPAPAIARHIRATSQGRERFELRWRFRVKGRTRPSPSAPVAPFRSLTRSATGQGVATTVFFQGPAPPAASPSPRSSRTRTAMSRATPTRRRRAPVGSNGSGVYRLQRLSRPRLWAVDGDETMRVERRPARTFTAQAERGPLHGRRVPRRTKRPGRDAGTGSWLSFTSGNGTAHESTAAPHTPRRRRAVGVRGVARRPSRSTGTLSAGSWQRIRARPDDHRPGRTSQNRSHRALLPLVAGQHRQTSGKNRHSSRRTDRRGRDNHGASAPTLTSPSEELYSQVHRIEGLFLPSGGPGRVVQTRSRERLSAGESACRLPRTPAIATGFGAPPAAPMTSTSGKRTETGSVHSKQNNGGGASRARGTSFAELQADGQARRRARRPANTVGVAVGTWYTRLTRPPLRFAAAGESGASGASKRRDRLHEPTAATRRPATARGVTGGASASSRQPRRPDDGQVGSRGTNVRQRLRAFSSKARLTRHEAPLVRTDRVQLHGARTSGLLPPASGSTVFSRAGGTGRASRVSASGSVRRASRGVSRDLSTSGRLGAGGWSNFGRGLPPSLTGRLGRRTAR